MFSKPNIRTTLDTTWMDLTSPKPIQELGYLAKRNKSFERLYL